MQNTNVEWEQKVDWVKLEIGLHKYINIMNQFRAIDDIRLNSDFQRNFNHFYRIRQKPKFFYESYYSFLEANKRNSNITFEETVTYFYNIFNRVEASFSSKLIATINPELPIWDKEVLNNIESQLKINNSQLRDTNKIKLCVEKYYAMQELFKEILTSSIGKDYIEKFDLRYPNTGISNLKKIDLILWQTRIDK